MMAKRTEDTDAPAVPAAVGGLPRMLTLDQVKEFLNVNSPLVYALVRSGELRAAQFGGRGYLGQLARMQGSLPAFPGREA